MQLTIIYILGAGNSGSTLLSMALGGHSNILSVGEMVKLDEWNSRGELCSCGETLFNCDTWSRVMSDDGCMRPVPVAPIVRRPLPGGSYIKRLRGDSLFSEIIERNKHLYRFLAEAHGVSHIVDVSKDPLHFYYLHKSGMFRIVPVLLTRSGEDYIDSSMRRGFGAWYALFRWIRLNLSARWVLHELRLRKYAQKVHYKELVNDPESVLERVCNAAGLIYQSEMFAFNEYPHHNIAGTANRFKTGPIQKSITSKSKRIRLFYRMVGGSILDNLFEKF